MSHTAKQTLLRYDSDGLFQAVKAFAKSQNQSINSCLNALLKSSLGVTDSPTAHYTDLDRFFGSWSASEEKTFTESMATFSQIEPDFWENTP